MGINIKIRIYIVSDILLSVHNEINIVQQPSTERGIEGYTMFYWLFGIP